MKVNLEQTPENQAEHLAQTRINLAARALGGDVLSCSDDFFAEKDNLLLASDPVFLPEKFTAYGKWMDGWESRRRRDGKNDWVIIRLAVTGNVEIIEVDTRHFQGNAPGAVQLEYIDSDTDPDEKTSWQPLAERTEVNPDFRNLITLARPVRASHIRLTMIPDGGIARLRVYGSIPLESQNHLPGEPVDTAAIMNGGRSVACSDSFFSSMQNLLLPGRGVDMHDGWETRRRRQGGHDWVIVRLSVPTQVKRIEVDTLHFKGNYPDHCTIEACQSADEQPDDSTQWVTILPEQKLHAHRNHTFLQELENARQLYTHVRLNIFPDGGVSRFRVIGYEADQL